MTVKELLEELKELEPNAEVRVCYEGDVKTYELINVYDYEHEQVHFEYRNEDE